LLICWRIWNLSNNQTTQAEGVNSWLISIKNSTRLNCPLPILRAKKSLAGLSSGQVLHIIATDPGSVKDFEAFAKQTGNELLESIEEGGKFKFLIKKA